VKTDAIEMRQLFALHIFIGILKFPRLRLYWRDTTRVPIIADTMAINRFMKLRNNLHLVIDKPATDDRLWKVRPIIDRVMQRCKELEVEENVCIDEQIVPFKGQLDIKQYIKNKPCKWGVKVFLLCRSSGLVYDGIVYQGKRTGLCEENVTKYGSTGALVVQLSQSIPANRNHKLFADNYFTSIPLIRYLSQIGVCYAGTVRPNRLLGCPVTLTKRHGRGTIEERVTAEDDVVATQWMDNRLVIMASNFVGRGQTDVVKRWDKTKKEYVEVQRPEVIRLYNKSMGGVDKMDFLIQLYRIFIRSRKWTLRVIFHYVNLAVNNSWLEYQRDADTLKIPKKKRPNLFSWCSEIAEALCKAGISCERKRGRPADSCHADQRPAKKQKVDIQPVTDVRFDGIGHWPDLEHRQQRCKNAGCGLRSKFKCVKCNVHLCVKKDNCFIAFHNEQLTGLILGMFKMTV